MDNILYKLYKSAKRQQDLIKKLAADQVLPPGFQVLVRESLREGLQEWIATHQPEMKNLSAGLAMNPEFANILKTLRTINIATSIAANCKINTIKDPNNFATGFSLGTIECDSVKGDQNKVLPPNMEMQVKTYLVDFANKTPLDTMIMAVLQRRKDHIIQQLQDTPNIVATVSSKLFGDGSQYNVNISIPVLNQTPRS